MAIHSYQSCFKFVPDRIPKLLRWDRRNHTPSTMIDYRYKFLECLIFSLSDSIVCFYLVLVWRQIGVDLFAG